MDSLLANYAFSDEEEDQKPQSKLSSSLFNSLPPPKSIQDDLDSKPTSLFSSLPKPKLSSLFQSLPKPKLEEHHQQDPDIKPKSQIPNKPQIPKRVVQFKPPISPYFVNSSHLHDDDDEEQERRRRKASEASSAQPLSVTSFLSAIPAPRNSATLGVSSGLASGVGSGRRAVVETESKVESDVGLDENENQNVASYNDPQSNFDPNVVSYEGYGGYEGYQYGGGDQNVDSGAQLQAGVASSYGGYGGYGGDHGNQWGDGSATAATMSVLSSGKRRRNDVPIEMVEVKQDELMKKPREDQAKVTGIAFGPSYQPVSTKGKPTKLHKRKHQIGSLHFDMKQKEMELQERRSRGFLTKAETQAKYGW